jgi:hypothetical protein
MQPVPFVSGQSKAGRTSGEFGFIADRRRRNDLQAISEKSEKGSSADASRVCEQATGVGAIARRFFYLL